MARKFCMIIGDGFTKDFVGSSINTSKPFTQFENESIGKYYKFFSNSIKDIHDEIMNLMSHHKLDNQFEAIEIFSEINRGDTAKECQLRRYLALTYSSLQRELDKRPKDNWRWLKWFHSHKEELSFFISFNYDLLLESTLTELNIKFNRTGSNEVSSDISILKPHGSIDFDIQQPQYSNVLDQANISNMIWNSYLSLNQVNGTVQSIPSTHWLLPRLEADIIPPSQINYQKELEWVKRGFEHYSNTADKFTDLIIMGHSYAVCDREEIDYFLERLSKNTLVHIINPQILNDLIEKIESLQLKYKIINDFETMPT
ncbi:hypothetical protein ACQCPP_12565 [Priestia megaterium]|uniref:hypothetical protein n=1 Tax=Priestia megaterium TaxID=1404 RepID=UPI003D08FFD8